MDPNASHVSSMLHPTYKKLTESCDGRRLVQINQPHDRTGPTQHQTKPRSVEAVICMSKPSGRMLQLPMDECFPKRSRTTISRFRTNHLPRRRQLVQMWGTPHVGAGPISQGAGCPCRAAAENKVEQGLNLFCFLFPSCPGPPMPSSFLASLGSNY